MLGLDFGSIGGILLFLAIGLAVGLFINYKRSTPEQQAAQRAELARIKAGEFDRFDDAYKASPMYEAAKRLENAAELLAAKVRQEAGEAKQTVSAVLNRGQYADPLVAQLQAQILERERELNRQVAGVPTGTPAYEGLDEYAARVGVDAAMLRMLASMRPSESRDVLAERIRNPGKFTEG